jgi:hypothetical protein
MLATLWHVVKESTQLYINVIVVIVVVLERFFNVEDPDCIKAFEAHVSA